MLGKLILFVSLSFLGMVYSQNIVAPSIPMVDEYYNFKIFDEYRNLENLKDSSTINWMKKQTNYAHNILNQIPNRQYYIEKRLEFEGKQSFSVNNINITENDLYFYLKKSPADNSAKLFFRKGFHGKEIELFNPQDYKKETKKSFLINYIKPNYNGSKVVIALTESGKEISEMVIYDLEKKKVLEDIIYNSWPADSGGISWLPDNNSFIYLFYPITDPNSNGFLKDMQSVIYHIGKNNNLNIVLSRKNNSDLKINPEDFPVVNLPQKDSKYLFGFIAGATNFQDTYYKPIKDFEEQAWKLLFDKKEKISNFITEYDKIIFISEKNNINAVYSTSLLKPNFKTPKLIIPSIKNEVINGIFALKNGFIITSTKNGVESKLYLFKNNKLNSIKLPFPSGNIIVETKNNQSNDFWITCYGWKNDSERFKYISSKNNFIPENIAPVVEYPEFKDIIVNEITITSHDGEQIPISIIHKKDLIRNGNNPLLIDAYGAYGTINSPYFAKTYLLWALKGGVVVIAHVRGGGEKGESWYKGGFKETKPNSWKDLLSSAEFMINENYTSPGKIAIWGASAGGITIGRAITDRPDLFKAAVIDAGLVNTLRIEAMPNGLNTTKELGSITNEKEFKYLLEMDSYQHIRKGVKYPALLITGGINDPRVSPWMPTKFAAKLQANNSSDNPILLKIDFEGGHGGDIPTAQRYANLADTFAFLLWQLEHSDYQPKKDH